MLKHNMPLPALSAEHPDRVIDCEFYLAPLLAELAEYAMARGWSAMEVDAALTNLARDRILSHVERMGTEQVHHAMGAKRRH
jgi:hypothetical protein